MENKANDTFAFDLENRLDDFFSDSLPAQDDAPVDEPETSKADLPLKELKSTILAIDWEITDNGLDSFINQVNGLTKYFADNQANQKLLVPPLFVRPYVLLLDALLTLEALRELETFCFRRTDC